MSQSALGMLRYVIELLFFSIELLSFWQIWAFVIQTNLSTIKILELELDHVLSNILRSSFPCSRFVLFLIFSGQFPVKIHSHQNITFSLQEEL